MRAVIFDLGETLVAYHDWDAGMPARWRRAHALLAGRAPAAAAAATPERYAEAMCAAETAHWERVATEHWSGPPEGIVEDGFARLGYPARPAELLAALDGYAAAVDGWATPYADAAATLATLRARGYRLGLLSNTWWAASWHNADLAAHGLAPLLDTLVYTSDLPHSKPHPWVFGEVARRLGVAPDACVMVGDRPLDDIAGALAAGMRGVLKTNGAPRPCPPHVVPTARVTHLAELPALLHG